MAFIGKYEVKEDLWQNLKYVWHLFVIRYLSFFVGHYNSQEYSYVMFKIVTIKTSSLWQDFLSLTKETRPRFPKFRFRTPSIAFYVFLSYCLLLQWNLIWVVIFLISLIYLCIWIVPRLNENPYAFEDRIISWSYKSALQYYKTFLLFSFYASIISYHYGMLFEQVVLFSSIPWFLSFLTFLA